MIQGSKQKIFEKVKVNRSFPNFSMRNFAITAYITCGRERLKGVRLGVTLVFFIIILIMHLFFF